ncbi:MORN3-like protein [Mya arenaria]|uniref:MORN repeat-containing protein 3 n=1 Tax=Mya arenaria TaxID=6604 RepID=A0ABY7E0S6_MYAAR|nr:MORN repeat-containing protein 3-like [Mya arenaria]XP_052801791.1 MORN repeat-containing protein 3-like [Mya arenaria]WAR03390.1 MORN3-like protein [Mya arenaria]WAR03422.1 MORN3-like protein [Mya arenaria]
MPMLKEPKAKQPLWKENDYKAQKKGIRNTVYSVNGDQYTGEWLNNLKDGKGTYKWKESACIYDGDWKKGKRNGFGTYSRPDTKHKGQFVKEYSGGWKNDMRHGYGTNFYTDEEYYEGEWYGDKRSGWGRMYYKDGTIYEGEWYDDKRNGQGMLRLPNENRYEGSWRDDKKNGPGKFYYLTNGQLYEGVWVDDIAKCGTMKDFDRNNAPEPTQYPIPKVELASVSGVLQESEEQFLHDQE